MYGKYTEFKRGDNTKMRQDSVVILRHCTFIECILPLYTV